MISQLSSSQAKTEVEKLLMSFLQLRQQFFIVETANFTSSQLSVSPSWQS